MRRALLAPLVYASEEACVGGAQALLADLGEGLLERGHSVTLFARNESFVPGINIETITVSDDVHPANFYGEAQERPADTSFFTQANLFLDLFLQLQHRSAEFDVIHVHAFDWPAYACSTLIHGIPLLRTLHLPPSSPAINTALRVLDQQSHALTLITVSLACARTYLEYTPIDAVIYNGLDLDAIPFSPTPSKEAPLLFAGRIAPEKGVEAAIEIAAMAGYRLLIAGGIYDRKYYEEHIQPKLQEPGERV